MTDGAMSYRRNRSLRELLDAQGIRHIVTPPYTPRWNGKVCVLALSGRPGGRRGSPLLLV
jgi:hypothetical protein